MSGVVRILGLDPGLAATGWGVIDHDIVIQGTRHVAHGVIKTSPDEHLVHRVEKFAHEFHELITKYALYEGFDSKLEIAVESYQNYGKVHWTGVQTLYVLGVILAQHGLLGCSVQLLGARQAKLLLGVTDGEKESVRARVTSLLGLKKPPSPLHASDALGIALARLTQLAKEDPRLLGGGFVVPDLKIKGRKRTRCVAGAPFRGTP